MRGANKWALTVLALLVLAALFFWKFSFRSAPEIEEIAQIGSPTNRWSAKVMMVVYGDHWFVNDARYEVRVQQADGKDQFLVYSTMASESTGLVVKWLGSDKLEVRDSADALRRVIRKPHPSIDIEYRPN